MAATSSPRSGLAEALSGSKTGSPDSSTTLRDAQSRIRQWTRSAVAGGQVDARVWVADAAGRLRRSSEDDPARPGDRSHSARRRNVLLSGEPLLSRKPGGGQDGEGRAVVLLLPMQDGDARLGVLEVTGPAAVLDAARRALGAVAADGAFLLRALRDASDLRRQTQAWRDVVAFAGSLVAEGAPEGAVRTAVAFCATQMDLPSAGWVQTDDGSALEFLDARGMESTCRARLRQALPRLVLSGERSPRERERIASRFRSIAGVQDVAFIETSEALLLAGGAVPEVREPLETVRLLMCNVLAHLRVVRLAEQRNEHLEVGIAMTAHEMRGPLLGARAAIEHALATEVQIGDPTGEFLRRSGSELGELADIVEHVLRWSTGAAGLRRRSIELVRVVEDAVRSCELEAGGDRVRISAPARVTIRGDAKNLKAAFANVVRNALTYSPSDRPVVVDLTATAAAATVSVRDFGAGVSPREGEAIFDPFVRGQATGTSRSGSGLGLYIARRVIEAHGGSIRLEPERDGARFVVELPAEGAS